MNRAGRLRKQIPGAPDELVAVLAARPAAEVDLIVAALRQARRDAIQDQADRRRQRKRDARTYRHYDESELTGRNVRMLQSQGARAGTSLDALAGMVEARGLIDAGIAAAVAGLREHDYSDEEIGQALGVTRQAVGQHYGRKGEFTADGRTGGAR